MHNLDLLLDLNKSSCMDNFTLFERRLGTHGPNITPPLIIEVSLPSYECERSFICMLGVSMLPFSTILIVDFEQCRFCLFFILSVQLFVKTLKIPKR
jgi:hypothetical protein